MRHFILAFAIFLVTFCVANVPTFAYALSFSSILNSFSSMMNTPFGGKITSTSKAGVTCMTGTGPITIQSSSKSGNGKEYLATNAGNKTNGQVRNNAYIIGLAQSSSPQCKEGEPPYEVPYTVTPSNFYGVSGGK